MRETGLKKNLACLPYKEKKQMIDDNNSKISISRQCELLDLSRSSYYFKEKDLTQEDYQLMNKIDEIFTSHPYYGTRRMSAVLISKGHKIGRKKVRKYYQMLALEPIYPKMNLSKRNQAHKVYPYLLRDVKISYVNQVFSSDITYIRLKQGFVYLVAIIDWYSRYVLSWSLSITLASDFCVEVLEEAIQRYGKPDIFNTDQGVQYTCGAFIAILQKNEIAISMDGKGRALDNVFIERFWRSLKQEKIYLFDLETVSQAKAAISEYIDFYNNVRLHQSLSYKTPKEVYFANININNKE